MKTKMKTVMLGLAFVFIISAATSARAIEYYGATQGFWKNHTELWSNPARLIRPNTLVTDVFDADHLPPYMTGGWGSTWTLIMVLSMPLWGCSTHVLLQQAVAAILNAQEFGSYYPLTVTGVGGVIYKVNAAISSDGVYGFRDVKLALADELEGYNKAGYPKDWFG